eukprot:GHVH01001314.1.p1 GENE.GHVH01001314.1~~GHVH01001314.1.p1  ORF type:complete len:689 (+),score=89.79 GHVH01001314.1:46-2112(+)
MMRDGVPTGDNEDDTLSLSEDDMASSNGEKLGEQFSASRSSHSCSDSDVGAEDAPVDEGHYPQAIDDNRVDTMKVGIPNTDWRMKMTGGSLFGGSHPVLSDASHHHVNSLYTEHAGGLHDVVDESVYYKLNNQPSSSSQYNTDDDGVASANDECMIDYDSGEYLREGIEDEMVKTITSNVIDAVVVFKQWISSLSDAALLSHEPNVLPLVSSILPDYDTYPHSTISVLSRLFEAIRPDACSWEHAVSVNSSHAPSNSANRQHSEVTIVALIDIIRANTGADGFTVHDDENPEPVGNMNALNNLQDYSEDPDQTSIIQKRVSESSLILAIEMKGLAMILEPLYLLPYACLLDDENYRCTQICDDLDFSRLYDVAKTLNTSIYIADRFISSDGAQDSGISISAQVQAGCHLAMLLTVVDGFGWDQSARSLPEMFDIYRVLVQQLLDDSSVSEHYKMKILCRSLIRMSESPFNSMDTISKVHDFNKVVVSYILRISYNTIRKGCGRSDMYYAELGIRTARKWLSQQANPERVAIEKLIEHFCLLIPPHMSNIATSIMSMKSIHKGMLGQLLGCLKFLVMLGYSDPSELSPTFSSDLSELCHYMIALGLRYDTATPIQLQVIRCWFISIDRCLYDQLVAAGGNTVESSIMVKSLLKHQGVRESLSGFITHDLIAAKCSKLLNAVITINDSDS